MRKIHDIREPFSPPEPSPEIPNRRARRALEAKARHHKPQTKAKVATPPEVVAKRKAQWDALPPGESLECVAMSLVAALVFWGLPEDAWVKDVGQPEKPERYKKGARLFRVGKNT